MVEHKVAAVFRAILCYTLTGKAKQTTSNSTNLRPQFVDF